MVNFNQVPTEEKSDPRRRKIRKQRERKRKEKDHIAISEAHEKTEIKFDVENTTQYFVEYCCCEIGYVSAKYDTIDTLNTAHVGGGRVLDLAHHVPVQQPVCF